MLSVLSVHIAAARVEPARVLPHHSHARWGGAETSYAPAPSAADPCRKYTSTVISILVTHTVLYIVGAVGTFAVPSLSAMIAFIGKYLRSQYVINDDGTISRRARCVARGLVARGRGTDIGRDSKLNCCKNVHGHPSAWPLASYTSCALLYGSQT